jgi:hypothetical protein
MKRWAFTVQMTNPKATSLDRSHLARAASWCVFTPNPDAPFKQLKIIPTRIAAPHPADPRRQGPLKTAFTHL